jgi:hypothetical protein
MQQIQFIQAIILGWAEVFSPSVLTSYFSEKIEIKHMKNWNCLYQE